ncbi:unnamed protein product [Caenorhabditis sp. 36 PRJEB53466]|nr:unnamed protein product [Caenorhabditis sp. 36 PRJEB53466]
MRPLNQPNVKLVLDAPEAGRTLAWAIESKQRTRRVECSIPKRLKEVATDSGERRAEDTPAPIQLILKISAAATWISLEQFRQQQSDHLLLSISSDAAAYEQEDTNNDHITIDLINNTK